MSAHLIQRPPSLREFNGPKYQRGIIVAAPVYKEAGAGAVVTLSGEASIFDIDFSGPPWNAQSGIRVLTNGTIQKFRLNIGGYSQIDATTDWIIPNGDASSSYEFKLDVVFNSPNFNSDSTGVWLPITATREWYVQVLIADTTISYIWTLRVRLGSGSELDNGTYSGEATTGLI